MSPLATPWLVVAGAVVAAWFAVLGWRAAAGFPETWAAVSRGMSEPQAQRIQQASGISPGLVAAIRTALPEGGRLVLYSPYPGPEHEFFLRALFERMKNLMYPDPRDVGFVRNADELRAHVQPGLEGKLVVVDGTQEPIDLSIGGAYELVHEEPIGAGRLRLWRLRQVIR